MVIMLNKSQMNLLLRLYQTIRSYHQLNIKIKNFFGLQFHPEVYHSLEGKKNIIKFSFLKFAK